MIGDKILIEKYHTNIAELIFSELKSDLAVRESKNSKFVISIAGESGSGKSEIAQELMRILNNSMFDCKILGQDDYFIYPPKTNHKMRLKNIDQVGIYEVQMNLINTNLFSFINGEERIYKPLINYENNIITHEIITVGNLDVIIVEGTYTSILDFINCRVFIDRTYHDTRENRMRRNREKPDPFLEEVLEREHRIISFHKSKADIIIKSDFSGIIKANI